MKPPKFAVNVRATKRLLAGHPWVFGNELQVPAKTLPPGGTVDITAPDGRFLGRGYANPKSLISVRICSRSKAQHIDLPGFWAARLREAVDLRATLYPGSTAYRLVNGESDGMPGLVLDRYGHVVVAQVTTLGMEQRLGLVLEALRDVLPELTVGVLRNDSPLRGLEGLPTQSGPWFGDAPEHVDIDEGGVSFRVHPMSGPRTGHFYDRRRVRTLAAQWCRDRTVLDVFSGSGGWGLHALANGATKVDFVDKSAAACGHIEANLELNGWVDRGEIYKDEARKSLMAMLVEGRRYGAVVLDPPPFAKTKKDAGSGLKGYKDINGFAMQLVEPGGFLFTNSGSYAIFEERFVEVVQAAARETGKRLKLLRRGEQSADHPVLPAMPESRTFKSYAFQVLPEV